MEKEKDSILNEKIIDKNNICVTIEGIENIHKQMKNSVFKIMKGEEVGTGFFCKLQINEKIINTVITNNHVIGKNDLKKRKIFISWNDENRNSFLELDNSRIKFTNEYLDVTIIELKKNDIINDKINNDDFLTIDPLIIEKEKTEIKYYLNNKSIYIINYPHIVNENKRVYSSFGILNEIKENKSEISYNCSTYNGSSGSPILSLNTQQVIGLHKGTNKNKDCNIGVFMKDIIDEFLIYLNNQFSSKNISLNNNPKINNNENS